MTWFWFSFADPAKPKGEQFLGGCWAEGDHPMAALRETHRRGINPGGEVQISELDSRQAPPEQERWKLLQRDDIEMERFPG